MTPDEWPIVKPVSISEILDRLERAETRLRVLMGDAPAAARTAIRHSHALTVFCEDCERVALALAAVRADEWQKHVLICGCRPCVEERVAKGPTFRQALAHG